MSSSRSTPMMIAMSCVGMPTMARTRHDEWQRARRHAGRADAAEHRQVDNHQLLREREIHARQLRQKQHRHPFVQRRAVLVGRCADRQHERADFARHAEIRLGHAQRGWQRGVRRARRERGEHDRAHAPEELDGRDARRQLERDADRPRTCGIASPPSTVTTYQPRLTRKPNPKRAVIVNSRHATPIGATFMTMSMIFATTLKTPSSTRDDGRRALARDERQRRAEHDREEHDADHVGRRSRHRLERVRRHERAHKRHHAAIRLPRWRWRPPVSTASAYSAISRSRVAGSSRSAGTHGVGQEDAQTDRNQRNDQAEAAPCARPRVPDAARRRCPPRRR